MNGWEAHLDAIVRLDGQAPQGVRAHPALGWERGRLWQRCVAAEPAARCICRPTIDGGARTPP